MTIDGSNSDKIKYLKSLNIDNEEFKKGLEELNIVNNNLKSIIPKSNYKLDFTIARGLDYYTGTVYETNIVDYPELGSVCSGGRFDNLAEYYTNSKLPGVGISIGLTRLFFQLMDKKIITIDNNYSSKVLIIPMDADSKYALKIQKKLSTNDISSNICYLDKGMKQKFKYADKLGIPYVIIVGEEEKKNKMVTLKDMIKGKQSTLTIEEAINKIK